MPQVTVFTPTGTSGKSAGGSIPSTVGSRKPVSLAPYASARTSAPAVASGSIGGSYTDVLRAIADQNNAFNVAQTEYVNPFNAREAQKNRDWQEYMAKHAHQFEVEDLKAAGLNPVLSALNGNGATVGSGASASGQKAVADNTLGNGIISMLAAMINASSAASVASIYANASMYSADQHYRGVQYSSDSSARSNDKNAIQRVIGDLLRFIK